MPTKNLFSFEYSYLSLPETFYSLTQPSSLSKAEIVLFNDELSKAVFNSEEVSVDSFSIFLKNQLNNIPNCYAQAYAGHQFGHFTKLGDGRAIMIGEQITENKERLDIQLKGSGRTSYSRNGDGKATLKAMLREYLISEAIYNLNIPSSRSLAIIKTNETIFRETKQEAATLVRVMKSHIRVGTFEFAAHLGTTEDVNALTSYTIKRLYPQIEKDENPTISLLKKVMLNQIELVVNWMRVGFIHGVMNTDNTSISGETFDYGPCAFMNVYHPATVFSSIDQNGRYAFGNQPKIIQWNIIRFAETLLPIIHKDHEQSIVLAQNTIDEFNGIWTEKYYEMMLNKIGIENHNPELYPLVDELLSLMQIHKLDYTNTFLALSKEVPLDNNPFNSTEFESWLKNWNEVIVNSNGFERAKQLMKSNNPVFIPRNHLVEAALDEAATGNTILFERLLNVVSKPYDYQANNHEYTKPSDFDFENKFQTFCGT